MLASEPTSFHTWGRGIALTVRVGWGGGAIAHVSGFGIEAMAARIGRLPHTDEVWFSPALARDGLDWLGAVEAPDNPRAAYLSVLLRRAGD